MILILSRVLLRGSLFATVLGLGGCCTAKCLDSRSSPDQHRVKARAVKLDVVDNDFISVPRRDRTDWKTVDLTEPGKLTAELHWDRGEAQLELSAFDALGAKIQDGRSSGGGGSRAVIAIEQAGRYYLRVRALRDEDETHYALRLRFKADAPSIQCHDCTAGERRCIGDTGYIVCAKVGASCNAWNDLHSCPAAARCSKGACQGCAKECRVRERRCTGPAAFQVCQRSQPGCLSYSASQPCPNDRVCRRGRCVKAKKRPDSAVVTPKPLQKAAAKAKIISIYRYRGRMTLHIEVGDNPDVKAGQSGVVLAGTSENPLPGGEIRISKVAGRYAIATTKLDKLGKNRWVRIKTR